MKKITNSSGQVLVTLLVFMVISIIITSAAVVILLVNSESGTKTVLGDEAYYTAESGAENALLRLLRDPYYNGETLQIGNGTATIAISGANPKTIQSIGKVGNFTRTIQVTTSYTDNVLTVTSWKELF